MVEEKDTGWWSVIEKQDRMKMVNRHDWDNWGGHSKCSFVCRGFYYDLVDPAGSNSLFRYTWGSNSLFRFTFFDPLFSTCTCG